jgi:hypothetical protein
MSMAVQEELQDFTRELFTAAGGIIDWPDGEPLGDALVTAEVAELLQLPSEAFALTIPPVSGGLSISLSGEFLDLASRILEARIPRIGSYQLTGQTTRKSDFQKLVEDSFSWNNVRVKIKQVVPQQTEYHLWHFQGTLKADDVWEGLVTAFINSRSLVALSLSEIPLELDDLSDMPTTSTPNWQQTFTLATELAQTKMLEESSLFQQRVEQRRKRDHKRLKDYYGALRKEASTFNKRTKVIPSEEEVQARERAIDLELRRKLAETDERYSIFGTLKPLTLNRVLLTTTAIELAVQRKQAIANYTLYWNPLLKGLEPLRCQKCLKGTYSPAFSNETVQPYCPPCWGR